MAWQGPMRRRRIGRVRDQEATGMAQSSELTCKEFVEVVSDYLDGDLSPDERGRIDAHLATCRGCRAYLQQMRLTVRLIGTLRDEPGEPVSDETKERLQSLYRAWRSGQGS
jgi:anti-sigma factor RsiW